MKTRIVQTSKGFIPQIFTPKFPWGGTWVGLVKIPPNNFFLIKCADTQLVKCTLTKKSDADLLLREYIAYVEDRRKL